MARWGWFVSKVALMIGLAWMAVGCERTPAQASLGASFGGCESAFAGAYRRVGRDGLAFASSADLCGEGWRLDREVNRCRPGARDGAG